MTRAEGKSESGPRWNESTETLGSRELAPVLLDSEADALLAVLEKANNAGITPGIGLRVEAAQAAAFKIVAERFRDQDPYDRGVRTVGVVLRSTNPDWRPGDE